MSDIRIAIIGAGIIADAHLAAIKASPQLAVTAIVEPNADRRQAMAEKSGAPAFSDLDQLLDDKKTRSQVDAVVICTPPSVRIALIEAALAAGLAVLAEKPLAHQAEDALALVNLAQKYEKTPTAVAFCHRYTPAIREMKRMAEKGDLGDLVRFENTFACWHPGMKTHWMSDATISGGGSLLDTGCHSLDLFHYLVGPSQVDAAVFHHQWAGRGDSNATLLIHSPSAMPGGSSIAGVLLAGWAEPVRFTTTLVGTAGLLHYDFEKPEELLFKPSTQEAKTLAVETHETRFQHQLEAFAELVRSPTSQTELASFEDGLAVSLTLQNAQEHAVVS